MCIIRCGYDAFACDVTATLTPAGPQELVVAVLDATGGIQPKGKQVTGNLEALGTLAYTAASGIWQTVLLEAVGETYLSEFILTPDLDGGRIILGGPEGRRDITGLPMYQRARLGISYLSQESSIFRKMTVEENIVSILETLPLSREEREQRLDQLLNELGIAHLRRQKAYTLSGGERRRLEITRALVINPAFILLDEPFVGVDPIAVLDIQNVIRQLRSRGIGIMITDHNVRETLSITDRAYILYEGKILLAGTAKKLAASKKAKEIYLGEKFTL